MKIRTEPKWVDKPDVLPPTVLVIEDDSHVRFSTAALFSQQGYSVLTAASGHDAIHILREPFSPIDLVVLDVYLSDISGLLLCARIRELFPHLPVIVWTGEPTLSEAAELRELGVERYLVKPVAAAELLAHVEAALG